MPENKDRLSVLDTAVLNNDKTAKVFSVVKAPVHVIRPAEAAKTAAK